MEIKKELIKSSFNTCLDSSERTYYTPGKLEVVTLNQRAYPCGKSRCRRKNY